MLLKGLHAFEGFFIALHHMYWQVYLHKTTRAYEILLEKILSRMGELLEKKSEINIQPELENLLIEEKLELQEFFLLDDCTILETIKKCRFSEDKILSDLCERFLYRKAFKCIRKKRIENAEKIIEIHDRSQKFYQEKGISHDYYFAIDEPARISVERPVLEKGLLVADIDKSGKISGLLDFINESDIIRSLYNVEYKELRMYCPENLADGLKAVLGT